MDAQEISRLNSLIGSARSAWFLLLGVVVFVVVTLLSIQDIDFFGAERSTKLPLVDVLVPTRLFFIAAPILVASVFVYLHLHLIRLWDAIGFLPSRLDGLRLGNVVSPWLMADAALCVRAWLRNDNCRVVRALDSPATLFHLGSCWGFGILTLAWLWWEAMTGRTYLLSVIPGICLAISLGVGSASLVMFLARMSSESPLRGVIEGTILAAFLSVVLTFVFINSPTLGRTSKVSLLDADIVERPENWLLYQDARAEFWGHWCGREALCDMTTSDSEEHFVIEWERRRTAEIRALNKPGLSPLTSAQAFEIINSDRMVSGWIHLLDFAILGGRREQHSETLEKIVTLTDALRSRTRFAPNFRGSSPETAREEVAFTGVSFDLRGAFLTGEELNGLNFSGARMQRAVLERASLVAADLSRANLSDAEMQFVNLHLADLSNASLTDVDFQGANFWGALMVDALLSNANLTDATFAFADMREASIADAILDGANFNQADLRDSALVRSSMRDVILAGADLREARLNEANLQGAFLDEADFSGANLSLAYITPHELSDYEGTLFDGSINVGGALRNTNLTSITEAELGGWNNIFIDGSVSLPDWVEENLKLDENCQWLSQDGELVILANDEEFFGRWRGWYEVRPETVFEQRDWEDISPEGFENVEAIPPAPGCSWHLQSEASD